MTEYTVGLKYVVNSAVGDPLRYADKLAAAHDKLEARSARGGGGSSGRRIADDWQKMAEKADRDQHRLNAEAVRSAQKMETAKRNAAFRRIQEQQREEERFTRYRIALDRRLAREKERSEQQQLQATLRRVRAAQQAEARSHAQATIRAGARGRAVGGAAQGVAGFLGGGIMATGAAKLGAGGYVGLQGVKTAQLIESARMRLTAQLGNKDDANAEIRDALRIAEKTIFDPDQVIDATAKLAINFKDVATRRYILGAVSDFATATGEGNEGLQRSIRAISQIAGKGKLQQEELTGQLGELGLSATKVYAKLAISLGIKGKTEQGQRDKVLKAITAGKVDSNRAIQAITDVMRDEKPAGQTAAGTAGTLSSQLSNIQKGLLTLFATSDIEQWPAMLALRDLLGDISGFFSVDSAAGQDFMATLRMVTAKVGVPLIESLRKALRSLTDSFTSSPRDLELFVRGLMDIGKTLFEIGTAFAYVTTKLIEMLGYLNELEGGADLPIWDWPARMKQLGVDMVTGFAEGMWSVIRAPLTAAEYLSDTVINTIRGKLQSHSPSRVAMEIGGSVPEGFALGMERGAGRVRSAAGVLPDAALSGMTPRAFPSLGGGGFSSGTGGRPSLSFAFTLPVTTAQDPAELTQQAMPMIMARVESMMDRYWGRQMAQGTG